MDGAGAHEAQGQCCTAPAAISEGGSDEGVCAEQRAERKGRRVEECGKGGEAEGFDAEQAEGHVAVGADDGSGGECGREGSEAEGFDAAGSKARDYCFFYASGSVTSKRDRDIAGAEGSTHVTASECEIVGDRCREVGRQLAAS